MSIELIGYRPLSRSFLRVVGNLPSAVAWCRENPEAVVEDVIDDDGVVDLATLALALVHAPRTYETTHHTVISKCDGCEQAFELTRGTVRNENDVDGSTQRIVYYCDDCWQIVDVNTRGAGSGGCELVRAYTNTPHTFRCVSCRHTVRVIMESLDETRRSNNEGDDVTDADLADGYEYCLACAVGDDLPMTKFEQHAEDCALCVRDHEPFVRAVARAGVPDLRRSLDRTQYALDEREAHFENDERDGAAEAEKAERAVYGRAEQHMRPQIDAEAEATWKLQHGGCEPYDESTNPSNGWRAPEPSDDDPMTLPSRCRSCGKSFGHYKHCVTDEAIQQREAVARRVALRNAINALAPTKRAPETPSAADVMRRAMELLEACDEALAKGTWSLAVKRFPYMRSEMLKTLTQMVVAEATLRREAAVPSDDAVANALRVLLLTPHIREYLAAHDPKALSQAHRAILGAPLDVVAPSTPRPLSFSDEIIAVEDGELPESAVAPRVANEHVDVLSESPSDFADALKRLVLDSDDFDFPSVLHADSFSEAGILHHTPYEDGFVVTLDNNRTFVVKVTER